MSDGSLNRAGPPAGQAAVPWLALAERILRCHRMFREDLARHAERCQLSEPAFLLLWACRQAPRCGVAQNQLAARLAVSAAQISGLVEKLRLGGLLEGRRAQTDRRRQLWRLTPAGEATLQAGLAEMADWAGVFDSRLGARGARRLIRLLDRLVRPRTAIGHASQRGAA